MWELLRGIFQMRARPYVLGGLSLVLGYFWAMAKGVKRPIPPELIAFHQAEQVARLRKVIFR